MNEYTQNMCLVYSVSIYYDHNDGFNDVNFETERVRENA